MLTIFFDEDAIGNGANGVVLKGKLNDIPVAVKTLFCFLNPNLYNVDNIKMSELNKEFEKEANLVKSLIHENLVQSYGLFINNNISYIVMELCENNLKNYLEEQQMQDLNIQIKFMLDIFKGLSFLHENKIIHRDIKPANILIKQNFFKLSDFGSSKTVDTLKTMTNTMGVGTLFYMAPEISSGKYNYKVDIWSVGIILLEIVQKIDGFLSTNDLINLTEKLDNEIITNIIIKQCLVIDKTKRLSSSQILNLINILSFSNVSNKTNNLQISNVSNEITLTEIKIICVKASFYLFNVKKNVQDINKIGEWIGKGIFNDILLSVLGENKKILEYEELTKLTNYINNITNDFYVELVNYVESFENNEDVIKLLNDRKCIYLKEVKNIYIRKIGNPLDFTKNKNNIIDFADKEIYLIILYFLLGTIYKLYEYSKL